jgi:hypothetical protein
MALPSPRGTSTGLALGPGALFIAPVGTAEPTDLTTAWSSVNAAWVKLGYTDAGSEFHYSPATDTVEVAEELDPVSIQTTGRTASVVFALAEITATNLKRAMNGGTITAGTGIVTFEPPDLGTETRTAIGFESEDSQERWVFRQCFQSGDLTVTRAKGAAKATISCEFSLEKPSAGTKLFKAVMNSTYRS